MPEEQDIQSTQMHRFEEDDRYLLSDPREINRVLLSLIEGKALMTANLAPRPFAFSTCLVDASLDEGMVTIDGSRDEALNASVLDAHHVTCNARLASIPVQFRLVDLQRTEIDGMAAFVAPLPERLLYLQRREAHRLQAPPAGDMSCSLTVQERTLPAHPPVHTVLQVFDISAGGIGVLLTLSRPDFAVGSVVDCVLHLPGSTPMDVRLAVRSRFGPPGVQGCDKLRAGCEFVSLPRGAEAQIQRYIFKVDRQRNARLRGEA